MSPPEADLVRTVSRFEANLLEVLRLLLQGDPRTPEASLAERGLGNLIFARCPRPHCLSRAAVELVQDFLRKGCPLVLARASGWWRERHLRANRVVEGRLWERTPPEDLKLSFSAHSLEFLLWITAENPTEKKAVWPSPPEGELTFGDRLLFYRAFGALRHWPLVSALGGVSLFAGNALCRLAYPAFFADEAPPPDLLPWTNGVGAAILEALQLELARHWLQAERDKSLAAEWQRMQQIGRSQERVLDVLLQALAGANRPDLARFLLAVLAEVLPEGARAAWWTGGLRSLGPRLADRTDTSRAALALVRQAERLNRWTQEARGVAFFEETYAASQLWKADWEHWQGDALHTRARAVLREMEPLPSREG